MPIVKKSKYKTPNFWYRNPHISTIYFGRFLKTTPPTYQRERLELNDGDFLDVDFILQSPKKVVQSELTTIQVQTILSNKIILFLLGITDLVVVR